MKSKTMQKAMGDLQPKIGIVSGAGPLAGANVLMKIFRAAAYEHGAIEDAEYPNVLLISHGVEDFDNTGSLNSEFQMMLTATVGQLENDSATIIGIACNTAHAYLDKIKIRETTDLINLLDETAIEAARSKRKYLLLTSAVAKQQKLHHPFLKKHSVNFAETSVDQQKLLDEIIGLIMAHRLEIAGHLMGNVLQQAARRGFDGVIAGCTELPLAIDHASSNYGLKVIDSNYILAQSLTNRYYNACSK